MKYFVKCIPLLISLLFVMVSCNKSANEINGYVVEGYVMSGKAGAATPIRNAHVYLHNISHYVDSDDFFPVFLETYTDKTGHFVIQIREKLIQYLEDSFISLTIEDVDGLFQKREFMLRDTEDWENMVYDLGVIFLSENK